METKIKIGISRCLLGEHVRYDGQHKHDRFITDTLGRYFEYAGVCPEVECGLPVPREAMRLVGTTAAPRLLTQKTGIDHTDLMQGWAARRLRELEREDIYGYIFKSRSPSSGMERVKVYTPAGGIAGYTSGIWAGLFMRQFPNLPVEDEGRLHDPDLRENFIERVFTLYRFRAAMRAASTVAALMDFHTRNKLLIMSHNETACRKLGKMLAGLKSSDARKFIPVYESDLMTALKSLATVKRHVNVLQHMLGHLRRLLDDTDRREMLAIIEDYHQGLTPLIVPVTMLLHHARRHKVEYLLQQYYLAPHPLELKLRNHA